MPGYSIRKSLDDVSIKKIDAFFLFFQLIAYVGMIKYFETDAFILTNFLIVLLFNFIKQTYSKNGLLLILFFLILIFIQTYFSAGANIFSNPYVGFLIRILTAFFLISYFGYSFFIIYENIVFILALISLPLFVIQLVNVKFFNVFSGISEMLINDERLSVEQYVLNGTKYFIIFGVNAMAEWRNSGFAWEPAGYGAVLLWAVFINLLVNNFKYNFKLLVLIIAALTTFSNGTYIAGLVLLLFALYNIDKQKALFIVIVFVATASLLYSLPLIRENVGSMIEKSVVYSNSVQGNDFKHNVSSRKNRIQGTILSIELIKKKPFGYGLDPKADLTFDSPSGLAILMFKFGVTGVFLLIILLLRLFHVLKVKYASFTSGTGLFLLFFLLTVIANPFNNQPFFLAFVLSGLIISKNFEEMNVLTHTSSI